MNDNLEPLVASSSSSSSNTWRELLEALANEEPACWMPPGSGRFNWTDLEALTPGASPARLAALFGTRQSCEFLLDTPAGEGTDRSALLEKLTEWAAMPHNRPTDSPTGAEDELYLGFPYLWVPPGLEGEIGSPPLLMPMARLPLMLDLDRERGVLTIQVRPQANGKPGRLQPNPVLLRWLEHMTEESSATWLPDASLDTWRTVPLLIERVCAALDLPEETGRIFTPFRPLPALGGLPFQPSILPAAVLGTFPENPPEWQQELHEWLEAPSVTGPAALFLNPEVAAEPATPLTLTASGSSFVQWWPGSPGAVATANQVRQHDLSIVSPAAGTNWHECASALIGEHLSRGERVLVVTGRDEDGRSLESSLEGLGLATLTAQVAESKLVGESLERDLIRRFGPPIVAPPAPAGDAGNTVETAWQTLAEKLGETSRALHQDGPNGASFHTLAGEWLELLAIVPPETGEPNEAPSAEDVNTHLSLIEEVLSNAAELNWSRSPWKNCLATRLEVVRATSVSEWGRVFSGIMRRAEAADQAFDGTELAFSPDIPIAEQITARLALADSLQPLVSWDRPHFCTRVALATPAESEALTQQRATLNQAADDLLAHPLDAELWARIRETLPSLTAIVRNLQVLESRLPSSGSGRPSPSNKSELAKVLAPLGLKPNADGIQRAWTFFRGLYHRQQLAQMVTAWLHTGQGKVLEDTRLRRDWEGTGAVLAAVEAVNRPALQCLKESTLTAIQNAELVTGYIETLRRSTRSAQLLSDFEHSVAATGLFSQSAIREWRDAWNRGQPRAPMAAAWHQEVRHLQPAVVITTTLGSLPSGLKAQVHWHADQGTPPEAALLSLRRAGCARELQSRCQQNLILRDLTGATLQARLDELGQLTRRRRQLLLHSMRRSWSFRRVHSSNPPTQKNPANSQTFVELRPVWITSRAQAINLFSPQASFDLVIFTSGSTTPLGEAIPLLQRARRGVILDTPAPRSDAGDAHLLDAAAPWDLGGTGPALLESALRARCPAIHPSTTEVEFPPTTEFVPPRALPSSRVHGSEKASRTVAALGALLRNRCRISTEVHWPTPMGPIDLALVDGVIPTAPKSGLLLDLPDWSDSNPGSVGASADQWERLRASGFSLIPVTTPELVQRGVEILETLAERTGVAAAPETPKPEESEELWTDFPVQ